MSNTKATGNDRKRLVAMARKFPEFGSDAEAEQFVDTADLSRYDFSGFKPMRFELEKKTRQINLRVPESLIAALKARARQRNIPYQRLIREAIEAALR